MNNKKVTNKEYSEDLEKILMKRAELRPSQKAVTKEEWEESVIDWTDFYRKNWDLYATEELGIKLFVFQQAILHYIGINEVFFLMCSRGLTKSFLGGLTGVIQAMLYPYSEIILTATTIKTATKLVKEKIEKELFTKFSPKLRYLYQNGYIKISYSQEEVRIDFLFNNSWLKILPEVDSSLGERTNCLLFEEARLLKQYSVDAIFMPMSRPRQALYLELPEYQSTEIDLISKKNKPLPELVEPCRKIYMTSTKYKYMWFFNRWKRVVEGKFNGGIVKYGFMCGDIFTALEHGIKTEKDLQEYKDTMSDFELRMEIYNEPIGEVEGSYFSLEEFNEVCVISEVFVPPTYEEYVDKKNNEDELTFFRKKKQDEKRTIFVDFAFSDSVKEHEKNDNTVIGCMSGYPNEENSHFFRNLEYLETLSGGKKDESILRIREIFYLYEADYLVIDLRNGGEDRYIDLTKSFYHEQLGITMNGFGIIEDDSILENFCNVSKAQNLRERVVDINSVPVTIPVIGSSERNNNFHIRMKHSLENQLIRLPLGETEIKRKLEKDVDFLMLEQRELIRKLSAHIQCDFLVSEAINLEKKILSGFISLETTGSNKRDRIVATEYANYLFYLFELNLIKKSQIQEFEKKDWINVLI